jgi:hypothetical protein
VVAAPLALAAVERRPVPDRDQDVLELRPPRVVRVDVARRDRRHPQGRGEVPQGAVPGRVAPLVRALELDVEPVGAEGAREPGRRVGVADREPVACAAGEADEAVAQLLDERLVDGGVEGRVGLAALGPCTRMRCGQQPAEVRVPGRVLDEQRHVRAVGEAHLRPRDRPDAERLRRVGELERAVDAVVVGERERLVAELGGARGELLRLGRSVEERIG